MPQHQTVQALVSALGVCRAPPDKCRHRAGADRRAGGTCGVRSELPFQLAGGVFGVHGVGAGDGPCTAAAESEAPFSCSLEMNKLFSPSERLPREASLQKGGEPQCDASALGWEVSGR